MKELLEYIVKSLVSNPDKVEIQEESSEGMVNFILKVDPQDMGVVIGRAGQTIKAIRRLLVTRALAENSNLRVNLNLQEEKQ